MGLFSDNLQEEVVTIFIPILSWLIINYPIAKHGGKLKKGYVRATIDAIERLKEIYGGN